MVHRGMHDGREQLGSKVGCLGETKNSLNWTHGKRAGESGRERTPGKLCRL